MKKVVPPLFRDALNDEQIAALKAAEQALEVEITKIDQAREAANLADTQNARQQTIELVRQNTLIAWAPPAISTVIITVFFACIALLPFVDRVWDER